LCANEKRHDRADVQVARGPAVQAFSDARGERVIDRRVTERALDAHRADPALLVEETRHTDDGVQFEQRERRRGVVEAHLPGFDLLLERGRQDVRVDLETDR
jgi:hypothetical protein